MYVFIEFLIELCEPPIYRCSDVVNNVPQVRRGTPTLEVLVLINLVKAGRGCCAVLSFLRDHIYITDFWYSFSLNTNSS